MLQDELIRKIEKLEIDEKLELVESIWNSIAASNDELPFPDWQKTELEKRYKEFKDGNYKLHGYIAVHDKLRQSKS